jgi:hypothetical protein
MESDQVTFYILVNRFVSIWFTFLQGAKILGVHYI